MYTLRETDGRVLARPAASALGKFLGCGSHLCRSVVPDGLSPDWLGRPVRPKAPFFSKTMAFHAKVTVLQDGRVIGYMRRGKALRCISEQCSHAWEEDGVSIRKLSLAEMVAARAEQTRMQEPLPLSEIPGLKFEPPPGALAGYRESRTLVLEAHQFAEMGA